MNDSRQRIPSPFERFRYVCTLHSARERCVRLVVTGATLTVIVGEIIAIQIVHINCANTVDYRESCGCQ
jgi:hypothetical protein